ncbi:MAG: hypothetical protein ACSHXK_04790 [Oceanococcus sp.]
MKRFNVAKSRRSLLAGFILTVLSVSAANAHGNSNMAPWEACKAQERGAACSFQDGHGDEYRGSCQLFSDALMCVRNQPIIRHSHDEYGHSHASPTIKGEQTTTGYDPH